MEDLMRTLDELEMSISESFDDCEYIEDFELEEIIEEELELL